MEVAPSSTPSKAFSKLMEKLFWECDSVALLHVMETYHLRLRGAKLDFALTVYLWGCHKYHRKPGTVEFVKVFDKVEKHVLRIQAQLQDAANMQPAVNQTSAKITANPLYGLDSTESSKNDHLDSDAGNSWLHLGHEHPPITNAPAASAVAPGAETPLKVFGATCVTNNVFFGLPEENQEKDNGTKGHTLFPSSPTSCLLALLASSDFDSNCTSPAHNTSRHSTPESSPSQKEERAATPQPPKQLTREELRALLVDSDDEEEAEEPALPAPPPSPQPQPAAPAKEWTREELRALLEDSDEDEEASASEHVQGLTTSSWSPAGPRLCPFPSSTTSSSCFGTGSVMDCAAPSAVLPPFPTPTTTSPLLHPTASWSALAGSSGSTVVASYTYGSACGGMPPSPPAAGFGFSFGACSSSRANVQEPALEPRPAAVSWMASARTAPCHADATPFGGNTNVLCGDAGMRCTAALSSQRLPTGAWGAGEAAAGGQHQATQREQPTTPVRQLTREELRALLEDDDDDDDDVQRPQQAHAAASFAGSGAWCGGGFNCGGSFGRGSGFCFGFGAPKQQQQQVAPELSLTSMGVSGLPAASLSTEASSFDSGWQGPCFGGFAAPGWPSDSAAADTKPPCMAAASTAAAAETCSRKPATRASSRPPRPRPKPSSGPRSEPPSRRAP